MRARSSLAVGCIAAFVCCCSDSLVNAGDWPPVEIDKSTLNFEKALAQPTTLEFIETPLQDVVDYLKSLHKIEIQIDHRALEDVGVGSDTPITRNLKGITLRSALRLMLKEMDLTFVVRDEVLLITTPEEADCDLELRVYDVKPLLDEGQSADDLIDVLACVAPHEFDDGPGIHVSAFRGLLVVRANQQHQRYFSEVLGMIATGLGVTPPKPVVHDPPAPMDGKAQPEKRHAESR